MARGMRPSVMRGAQKVDKALNMGWLWWVIGIVILLLLLGWLLGWFGSEVAEVQASQTEAAEPAQAEATE